MFPNHNGDNPFFIQFSSSSDPPQHTSPYNIDFAAENAPVDFSTSFPLPHDGFLLPHDEINAGFSLRRTAEINEENLEGDRKKKHRDIERLRRKEMAALYSNLRSVVPPEYMKRKRSAADLMNEAKNYIKDLEEKVKEMSITRDELKKPSNRNFASGSSSSSSSNFVEVSPWSDGVEIIVGRHVAPEECLRLSAIIEALAHEGIDVVSWVSNREGRRMMYTIHCEVTSSEGLDLTQLKLWLTNLVSCCIVQQDV